MRYKTATACALTLAAGLVASPLSAAPLKGQPLAEVSGTVVSIRAGILVVRPSLRPLLTRVSVGDKTDVVISEESTLKQLKPGMRLQFGGTSSGKEDLHLFWVEAGSAKVGPLAVKFNGLQFNKQHTRVHGGGTIKSTQPLVVIDDTGRKFSMRTATLRYVFLLRRLDKRSLLIGSSLYAMGPPAPDGVIQATMVEMDSQFAKRGTMFGTIVSAQGGTLQIRPRYTSDILTVTRAPGCTIQRQITLDPDSIKVGAPVVFWGQPEQPGVGGQPPKTLDGLALLQGDQRYPSADTSQGQVFLAGKLASLDPVTLETPTGNRVRVVVPAEMPLARLESATPTDLKPDEDAMLILVPQSDGSFATSAIVLDASPWVGYGG